MARHARRLILWTTGVLLSLALLAILGIALLVFGLEPDVFRGRIERAASDALGRRVEFTGALRWQPGLNFRLESLGGRIANSPGFGSAPLASWRSLRLGVALRPLLDRRLVIDQVELEGLHLDLQRGPAGVNWSLPETPPPGGSDLQLELGSITLRDAAVAFTDTVGARAWRATQVSLEAQLPGQLDMPRLRLGGLSLRARLEGAPIEAGGASLRVEVPELELDRARGRLTAGDWEVHWNDAQLNGSLDLLAGADPTADMSLRLQAPSLRRLLQSASIALPATRDAQVFGPLDLAARVQVRGGDISLGSVDLKLDSTRLAGEAGVIRSPLSVRFKLSADQVEVDRYLPPQDAPGTPLELPLAQLKALDAKGVLVIQRATLAGVAAREMRIDVD